MLPSYLGLKKQPALRAVSGLIVSFCVLASHALAQNIPLQWQGTGNVGQAQLFGYEMFVGPTDNNLVPGGGWLLIMNTAPAGDFSTKRTVAVSKYGASEAFDAGRFYNPRNVPIGDDHTHVVYGENFTFVTTHKLVNNRPPFTVNGVNGSGQVTGITAQGTPSGYAANQTAIQARLFNATDQSITTEVWGYANASGVIAGFSATKGGTANDAFPTAYTGFSAANPPLVLVQGPDVIGTKIALDGGPAVACSRDPTPFTAAPGSVVGPCPIFSTRLDDGNYAILGSIYAVVDSDSHTSPRSHLGFTVAAPPAQGSHKEALVLDMDAGYTRTRLRADNSSSLDTMVGGVLVQRATNSQLMFPDGVPSAPGLGFYNETNSGFARAAQGLVGIVGNGQYSMLAGNGALHVPEVCGTPPAPPVVIPGFSAIVANRCTGKLMMYANGQWYSM